MRTHHPITSTTNSIITGIVAAAAALTLAACSSGSTTTAAAQHSGSEMHMSDSSPAAAGRPADGPHNSADVAFATDMIPHHRQAVQMADMALSQATDARVTALAATIKADQDPEIVTMSGWLTGWGASVPSSSMGDMSMPGMMSDADMGDLGKASGAAFDRMWVQLMLTHHRGALSMAGTEIGAGRNADAKALARSITTSQTAQITELEKLLTTLPGS